MEKNKTIKEIILFFAITLSLSYFIFWGPLAIFKIPGPSFNGGASGPIWAIILYIIGGFVPSIVGIALTGMLEGKKGLKELFKKFIQFHLGYNYILIFLIPILIGFGLILLYIILGGIFPYYEIINQLPFLIPLIILGPISEEFGWRGYATEKLLKVTNPNLSSLITGLGWSLWHLPLFYIIGASQRETGVPFITFLITTTSISFIFTYFYIHTKGSILSAVLFHWIYTYVIQVIYEGVKGRRTPIFNNLEFLPAFLISLVFVILMWNKKRQITYDL